MFLFPREGLRYLSIIGLVLALIASIGPAPAYNPALLFFIIITSYFEIHLFISLSTCLVPFSMILDIIWCIFNGIDANGVTIFSLVITVLLLFVKIPICYFCIGLFMLHKCELSDIFKVQVRKNSTGESAQSGEDRVYSAPQAGDALKQPLNGSKEDNNSSTSV
jgi:hypothetical protein